MNSECVFCRIVAGTIPAKRVYEDDVCLGFADIHPAAPTHLLLISKQHIKSLAEVGAEHASMLGHMVAKAAEMAQTAGLGRGFRLVINTGDDGGQTVDHLHMHVLGGRHMSWPPG